MTPRSCERFMIGYVAMGCILAMFYLLWTRQMNEFYTVLIGAAYFWFDRVRPSKEDNEDKHGKT